MTSVRPSGLLALTAAVALLTLIVLATLVPISLRPHTGHVHVERVSAYLALGALSAFAVPNRWPWVLLGVVLIALGLEWLQTLIPTRDGRLPDALEKTAGGALGVSAGLLAAALEQHIRDRPKS